MHRCFFNRLFCLFVFVLVLGVGGISAGPAWGQAVKKIYQVAMRDGVKLHTVVLLPPQGKGPWPVALLRTPYSLGSNPIEDQVKPAVQLGVVVVTQYMRGRFKSEGEDTIFGNAKKDGADTVAWIKKQSWCDGKITTVGPSALGIHQYLMAETTPGLASQMVLVATPDVYKHVASFGGVLRQSLVLGWLEFQAKSNGMTPPHPILKEIGKRMFSNDPFWDTRRVNDWSRVNVRAIHLGGWYDCFSQGTLDAFVAYRTQANPASRNQQKLIMGPWTHTRIPQKKQGDLTYPASAELIGGMSLVMFFGSWILDYVKGGTPSLQSLAPVNFYIMGDTSSPNAPGNRWLKANDWPPPSKPTRFYLAPQRKLSQQAPTKDKLSETYTFDPKNPVPTRGGQNLEIPAGPKDQRSVEKRSDVLLFTTDPLQQPLAVVGPLQAKLWVSTDAKDTDFTVKITDVYPDGRSMLVLDGIVRLRHRNTSAKEEFVTPNTPTQVTVSLWSTAIIFNKGHSIRVAVSSSNSPRFQVNPNTGAPFSLEYKKFQKAQNTVYYGKNRPSYVILPVIPLDQLDKLYNPPAEPAPEPAVEPTPEPAPEPLIEPVLEEDSGTTEPVPEPAVEPTPEPSPEPTPSDVSVTEGKGGDGGAQEKTSPPGGCQCGPSRYSAPWGLFALLLLGLLLPQRRRRRDRW